MPMHVRVCTGAEARVCCLGTWKQGAPPAGLLSLGYGTPACPCSPKGKLSGPVWVPCCWEHCPALHHGHGGWAQQSRHHLGFACAPGRPCPKDATSLSQLGCMHRCAPAQPSALCRVTATTTSHWHLSPCPAAWHAVPALRASPPWSGASLALPRPAEPARVQHHDAQEPYRKGHHVQAPKGPCPALWCGWVTGTQLSHWHGVGSSRKEGAAPAHLLQAKVKGVLMVPSVQPLISFIDLFSMESSN